MKNPFDQTEKRNKDTGKITSTIIHLILIALLFFNFFTYPDPPPGQEGFTVIGAVDVISNNPKKGETVEPENKKGNEVFPKEIESKETPKKIQEKSIDKNVKNDANSEEIALAQQLKEQQEAALQAEKDRMQKEQDAINKSKQLFDNSKQGDPDGTNDGDDTSSEGNLKKLGEGISLGGGLGDRGVVNSVTFDPVEQVSGKVSISVCVNSNGNVLSAERTLKNTTITSQAVIKQAEKFAKKWKFEKGKKACGTITYIIKLK